MTVRVCFCFLFSQSYFKMPSAKNKTPYFSTVWKMCIRRAFTVQFRIIAPDWLYGLVISLLQTTNFQIIKILLGLFGIICTFAPEYQIIWTNVIKKGPDR